VNHADRRDRNSQVRWGHDDGLWPVRGIVAEGGRGSFLEKGDQRFRAGRLVRDCVHCFFRVPVPSVPMATKTRPGPTMGRGSESPFAGARTTIVKSILRRRAHAHYGQNERRRREHTGGQNIENYYPECAFGRRFFPPGRSKTGGVPRMVQGIDASPNPQGT